MTLRDGPDGLEVIPSNPQPPPTPGDLYGTPVASVLAEAMRRRGLEPCPPRLSEGSVIVAVRGREETTCVVLSEGESIIRCTDEETAVLLREALLEQLVEV